MPDKVYTLRCNGEAIGNYRTRQEALEMKKAIEEAPFLYLKIQEWDPKEHYHYVKFKDFER